MRSDSSVSGGEGRAGGRKKKGGKGKGAATTEAASAAMEGLSIGTLPHSPVRTDAPRRPSTDMDAMD